MLTMVITLPIPGLITKWNAQYQKERMTAVSLSDHTPPSQAYFEYVKTDSRIDIITEGKP